MIVASCQSDNVDHGRTENSMRIRTGVGLLVVLVLGAACGGDDETPSESSSSTADAVDEDNDEDNDGPQATSEPPADAAIGTITVDIGTFELVASGCELGAGGTSAMVITAMTPNGAYTFSAGGVAGAITIGFEETGTDNVWTVVGGAPVIDGTSFTYDGPALRTVDGVTDPATSMSVDIQC